MAIKNKFLSEITYELKFKLMEKDIQFFKYELYDLYNIKKESF